MRGIRLALALVLGMALAVGGLAPGTASEVTTRPGAESDFIDVNPIDYSLIVREEGQEIMKVPFTTSMARVFYTFQPADIDGQSAPLFVFLNGGPGAATTANFFANNTAPYSINLGAIGKNRDGVVKNPNSWTQMGNLLYIDPPQSGFSYNVSEQVFAPDGYIGMVQELWKEYMARGNFNPMIDADQLLRVILGFLAKHPEFQTREIVMVGESYGGVRVSTILHMLMNSQMYDEGGSSFFQDPGLARAIREHFGTGATAPTVEQVAAQFDRQVLVQPQLSSYQMTVQGEMYWDKRWSVIDWLAEDTGHAGGFTRDPDRCRKEMDLGIWTKATCPVMVYVPAFGRDRYDYAQPTSYSDDQDAYSMEAMRDVTILSKMLGVDPRQIEKLKPAARKNAYHTIGYPLIGRDSIWTWDTNRLAGALGNVNAPDTYYLSWNRFAYVAGTQNLGSVTKYFLPLSPDKDPIYGQMFLENLQHVKTFLTDAKRDLVIYSPALPEALRRHKDLVADVEEKPQDPSQPGQLIVRYQDGSKATVRWPLYADAGHAVAMTMPAKLLKDVNAWLDGYASTPRSYVRWGLGPDRLARWRQRGVTVRATRPAVRIGARVLFTGTSDLGGSIRWKQGRKVVTWKSLKVDGDRVTAMVGGQRIPVLIVKKGTARLAPDALAGLPTGQRMGRWVAHGAS